jgi:hypothetical protein
MDTHSLYIDRIGSHAPPQIRAVLRSQPFRPLVKIGSVIRLGILLYLILPVRQLLSRFRRNPPFAPFASVRAPKGPLLPRRSASVALEEPD